LIFKTENDSASEEDFGMDVKGKVLLQLFNKKQVKKLGQKRFYSKKFFSIYSQI